MTEPTYTIGQMCAEFGVTARTLRFYENDKGLLNPIREGQKRLFTNRCRARLKLILRGARFGFSLNEIKVLLHRGRKLLARSLARTPVGKDWQRRFGGRL